MIDPPTTAAAEAAERCQRLGREADESLHDLLDMIRLPQLGEELLELVTSRDVVGRLQKAGGSVMRRYCEGQWLTVRRADASWVDMRVLNADGGCQHHLCSEGGGDLLHAQLHPWNHAPRELPFAAYEATRLRWAASMRMQLSLIHI